MLKTRIYTALVLLPLLLAALFYAPVAVWALLLLVMMLIGAWEWGGLAGWQRATRLAYAGGLGAGALLLWYVFFAGGPRMPGLGRVVFGASLLFWVAVVPLWLARGWRVRAPLALAVTGAILLLPTWLALLLLQAEPWMLLMLMAIVWISDTAAYFCGKRWGRRKLAASISPGKTWEGVYGALVAVAVYFAVLSAGGTVGHVVLQGATGCGVFLLLTVLGMEGDLFESWVKRTAGVKDSGTALPGHGGVLDRVDALLASMPAAALLLSVA
jgi:phosphatidate cytidylyltransferase